MINYLSGNLTLLDATINKFEIQELDHVLQISIKFHLSRRTKADITVLLIFKDVVEYGFYHNNKHNFYNVEELKFFETEGKFYFSGDPYHTKGISENDNDFVLSKELEGYSL